MTVAAFYCLGERIGAASLGRGGPTLRLAVAGRLDVIAVLVVFLEIISMPVERPLVGLAASVYSC